MWGKEKLNCGKWNEHGLKYQNLMPFTENIFKIYVWMWICHNYANYSYHNYSNTFLYFEWN